MIIITYHLLSAASNKMPGKHSWSEFPFSSPGDLPDPGIKALSLASFALLGGFFITAPPGKAKNARENHLMCICSCNCNYNDSL